MSVRDLIAAAFNKDAASFEDTLNVVMQEKMAAAVQARFSPAVYEEEVDLSEAKGLHDYDWPKSGMDRDATLGDHAHDAIHHGMHARDAIDHIYSAADDHGKKWVNKHHDDLLKTFKSHGLKSESQFDEEDELEEEIKDGDKVSWHDPNVGKNVTGVVTMASGMKRKGIKHAQVRIDNSHGTTTKVPHSQLKKISEEVDLEEEIDLEEALKIGSKVRIHAPGKDYHGKIGHVGEIRKRTYGTMAPSYTVDYREPGEDYNRSVSLSREKIKLHKEEVDQIDEISGAKLGTYLIKARKSEAELDKKRDDSYDKPNTPENKAERKAISRTLNKRRWGHGKALDKLTGSSFAKVHATEK